MKNFKNIFPIISFLTMLLFISCSEDPVKFSEEFDPPRYSWSMDTIEADVIDIWAYDTNNVYYADKYYYLAYYNGTDYDSLYYGGDISASAISGYDNNNVFIGGTNTLNGKLMLKKWNGAGFVNLFVNDTIYQNTIITSVKVISPANIWSCTSNGRVFNYNGVTFDTYCLDSGSFLKPILVDAAGSIYIAGHIFYPSFPFFDSVKVFVKKFDNRNWINVYEEIYPESAESTNIVFHNAGSEIVSVHIHDIFRYDGSSFQKILSVDQILLFDSFFGFSTNDMLCLGSKDGLNKNFYHWNGSRWSIELGVSEYFPQRIFGVNNGYFATYSDDLIYETIIYKGKIKH